MTAEVFLDLGGGAALGARPHFNFVMYIQCSSLRDDVDDGRGPEKENNNPPFPSHDPISATGYIFPRWMGNQTTETVP